MAVLGIDDFKSKIKGGGARANLFKATLNFPGFADGDVEIASFLCEAAQLPGSQMGVVIVPFRGRQLKIAGDRVFDDWVVTIINDTDFKIRNSFEKWMNGINAHSENTGLTNPLDYQADMFVEQLDRDGSALKRYDFRGCFPSVVSPIEVSYGQNDDIERFQVNIQVQYWEDVNITT
jgi:hypothetical protein